MIKVVVYARVFTAEQAEEGYSIDAQIETVRKKCELEDRQVINQYVDRGISGKSIEKRDALKRLLNDAKEEKFDEVWVWKTNRLVRNHLDLLKIVDQLNKYNVAFKSCSEAFDTSTASGKLMMNVLASIGEFERETIVENVKMGMKQRAKSGKWNGGIVLGYRSTKYGNDKEKSKLEIVEDEAEIVKMIFELYASGRGLKSLVNHINQLGYKTKKGNMFAVATIKQVLQNPIYIGKIRYNRMRDWSVKRRKGKNENPIIVEGEHQAIIDMNLWDKVQKIYMERSHKPIRNFSGSYPLTGILKCPQCGASMVAGVTKKRRKDGSFNIHRYYYCGNWRNKGIAACRSNAIKKDYIEDIVFGRIKKVLCDKLILKDIVSNINKRRTEKIQPLKDRLIRIEKDLKIIGAKKAKIFDLYEEGIINKQDLAERLKESTNKVDIKLLEKEKIQNQLEQNNSEPIDFETVNELMIKFNSILGEANAEKKKLILNLVVKAIIVNPDRTVKSILVNFDQKTKSYLMKQEDESDTDSSSFMFSLEI
ncbi:recombinase family protein [Bacillus velezensis]|uniref:recombinase family protein n=1 Tax=Bacillus velezensis TaxID=492670 RepID=UPI0021764E03|nr:recombinase family protein [Bacillus velezensis]